MARMRSFRVVLLLISWLSLSAWLTLLCPIQSSFQEMIQPNTQMHESVPARSRIEAKRWSDPARYVAKSAVYIADRRVNNTCIIAGMSMTNSERFVQGIADFGNLFLIITLPEMRKQGINYLALYVLQKAVEAGRKGFGGYPESKLREETGLADYEISRACKPLINAGLVSATVSSTDKRSKILVSTSRGEKVLMRIFSAAAQRLHVSIEEIGRFRRLQGAVEHLRKARQKLHGSMQLSFFEREFQRGKRPKVPVPRKLTVRRAEP